MKLRSIESMFLGAATPRVEGASGAVVPSLEEVAERTVERAAAARRGTYSNVPDPPAPEEPKRYPYRVSTFDVRGVLVSSEVIQPEARRTRWILCPVCYQSDCLWSYEVPA